MKHALLLLMLCSSLYGEGAHEHYFKGSSALYKMVGFIQGKHAGKKLGTKDRRRLDTVSDGNTYDIEIWGYGSSLFKIKVRASSEDKLERFKQHMAATGLEMIDEQCGIELLHEYFADKNRTSMKHRIIRILKREKLRENSEISERIITHDIEIHKSFGFADDTYESDE